MKFIPDANLPERLIKILKEKYKVSCYREKGSLSDAEIYHLAKKEKRILLTLDTDFLNILRYPPHQHLGIVVFRLSHQNLHNVIEAVLNFFETFKDQLDRLSGSLVVVRKDKYRIYH